MSARHTWNFWRFRAIVRRDLILAAIGRLWRRKATCRDCGHFFDPADERAFIPSQIGIAAHLRKSCPACQQISAGHEAWATHNDCNGVFDVYYRRAEARAAADDPELMQVVPVRVLVEHEDERWKRDWDEDQREREE